MYKKNTLMRKKEQALYVRVNSSERLFAGATSSAEEEKTKVLRHQVINRVQPVTNAPCTGSTMVQRAYQDIAIM